MAGFGVRFFLIPLLVGEGLALGTEWAGIGLGVFAVTNALALFPAGRLVDGVGRKPLMILGTTTATAGMALEAGVPVQPPVTPRGSR